jgi:hypothetical protein
MIIKEIISEVKKLERRRASLMARRTAARHLFGCTSNAQCPAGKLCCYPCGIDGCTNMCVTPVKGRCPLYV